MRAYNRRASRSRSPGVTVAKPVKAAAPSSWKLVPAEVGQLVDQGVEAQFIVHAGDEIPMVRLTPQENMMRIIAEATPKRGQLKIGAKVDARHWKDGGWYSATVLDVCRRPVVFVEWQNRRLGRCWVGLSSVRCRNREPVLEISAMQAALPRRIDYLPQHVGRARSCEPRGSPGNRPVPWTWSVSRSKTLEWVPPPMLKQFQAVDYCRRDLEIEKHRVWEEALREEKMKGQPQNMEVRPRPRGRSRVRDEPPKHFGQQILDEIYTPKHLSQERRGRAKWANNPSQPTRPPLSMRVQSPTKPPLHNTIGPAVEGRSARSRQRRCAVAQQGPVARQDRPPRSTLKNQAHLEVKEQAPTADNGDGSCTIC